MNRLYYFYPENDMALAADVANYTASLNAALFRKYCGMLMRWVGSEGDYALYDTIHAEWEEMISSKMGISAAGFSNEDAKDIKEALPWGWSKASRRNLIGAGVDPTLMPDDDMLDRWRLLSHRRSSITINHILAESGVDVPSPALEINEMSQLRSIDFPAIIKSPWSSSGRGVFDASTLSKEELERRVAGIIRRQGSAIVEHRLNRVADFAMLFEADGSGEISCLGLSSFTTSATGEYNGNIVAPQSVIKDYLQNLIPEYDYEYLAQLLSNDVLPQLLGDSGYRGPLGIDMMIYRDNRNRLRVAPCIELNLRWTMGIVAMRFAERYLAEGSVGRLYVRSGAQHEVAAQPIIADCRLVEGCLPLNSPNPYFSAYFEAMKSIK